jgi:hypothetical protein
MPQFQISSYPVDTHAINNAMFLPTTQQMTLNDRYARMFTRTGFNTQTSYNGFVNVPGFSLQQGSGLGWWPYNFQSVGVPISTNFPGIQNGDPFSIVVHADGGWARPFPTTHSGFNYGTAATRVLFNILPWERKRWRTIVTYDGSDTVYVTGVYEGARTDDRWSFMRILALRFGVNATGWATGDGNSVSVSQTFFALDWYVANHPQNFNIAHFTVPFPPAPEPDPGTPMGS